MPSRTTVAASPSTARVAIARWGLAASRVRALRVGVASHAATARDSTLPARTTVRPSAAAEAPSSAAPPASHAVVPSAVGQRSIAPAPSSPAPSPRSQARAPVPSRARDAYAWPRTSSASRRSGARVSFGERGSVTCAVER